MSNKTSSLFKILLDVKEVRFLRAMQRNTRRTHQKHFGSCGIVAERKPSLQLCPAPPIRTPSCSFFNLAAPISTRRMEYSEHRTLKFTPEQIFSVVANVDEYQYFVPWCKKSQMMKGPNGDMRAELEIGFPPITERYTSELTFVPNHQIRAVCTDGALFSHLETIWRFAPGSKDPPGSCKVDFFSSAAGWCPLRMEIASGAAGKVFDFKVDTEYFKVSFEFKSVLHAQLASVFFDEVVKQMVGAFESHAAMLYRDKPSFRRRPALDP